MDEKLKTLAADEVKQFYDQALKNVEVNYLNARCAYLTAKSAMETTKQSLDTIRAERELAMANANVKTGE